MKCITNQTNELIRFAGYLRDVRAFPVAGGTLDQTEAFLEAAKLIEADRASWRAHFGLA